MAVPQRAITILIADDSRETRESLKKILAFEDDLAVVADVGDGAEAVRRARELAPDIVLMDVNMPGEYDGIAATQVISLEVPESVIIMMSVQGEQEYVRRAMAAGAREYLTKPFSGDELVNTIRRVHELESTRRSRFRAVQGALAQAAAQAPGPAAATGVTTGVTTGVAAGVANGVIGPAGGVAASTGVSVVGGSATGPITGVAAPAGGVKARAGKLITVFGSKGGAGKTVVAVNLAVVLAREKKVRVALVDLDLEFGDVAVMLDMTPKRTIAELAREEEPLDGELVESYLLVHSSGVRVLPAPLSPEHAETIGGGHVNAILVALRHRYDVVIIDAPPSFTEPVLAALDASEMILAVTTMELPALKNMAIGLNILATLGYPEQKVKLVLNRFSREFGLTLARVEDKLGVPVWATIPSDGGTVVPSVNSGVPFVLTEPRRPVSAAIRRLAEAVLGGWDGAGGQRGGERGDGRSDTNVAKKGILGGLRHVFTRQAR